VPTAAQGDLREPADRTRPACHGPAVSTPPGSPVASPGPCSTTSSPMPSARCGTPSRRPSSSARRSRSGSRSTCSSATPRGRPPTGCPARDCRRGCRPTSPLTGPPGPRPRTGRGTSASRSTSRPASRSRSCCASSGSLESPTSRPCSGCCPSQPVDRRRDPRALGPDHRDRLRHRPRRAGVRPRGVLRGLLRARRGHAADGSVPRRPLLAMGGWIASTLVRLGRPRARLPAPRGGLRRTEADVDPAPTNPGGGPT
jgi:hypothetical protein